LYSFYSYHLNSSSGIKQKKQMAKGTPLVAKFKTDGTKDVTLFYDDDPKAYRIPAIATTGTGRIIAVSDYRQGYRQRYLGQGSEWL
jgi:hypothetical protein